MITKKCSLQKQFSGNYLRIKKREGKLINMKIKMCLNMTLMTNMNPLLSIFLRYHLNVVRISLLCTHKTKKAPGQ